MGFKLYLLTIKSMCTDNPWRPMKRRVHASLGAPAQEKTVIFIEVSFDYLRLKAFK